MGLDISVITDNYETIFTEEYHNNEAEYFKMHSLSRTFCDFICRRVVVQHIPELDQIGKITNLDNIPFYDMEAYPDEEGIAFFLETAENEEERWQILSDAEAERQKVANNIDLILQIVTNLIDGLSQINNLPELLLPTDFDTLNNAVYFSNFNSDKGQGYIDNNFGQDLRNFKRFVEYAKSAGATTVWFTYN